MARICSKRVDCKAVDTEDWIIETCCQTGFFKRKLNEIYEDNSMFFNVIFGLLLLVVILWMYQVLVWLKNGCKRVYDCVRPLNAGYLARPSPALSEISTEMVRVNDDFEFVEVKKLKKPVAPKIVYDRNGDVMLRADTANVKRFAREMADFKKMETERRQKSVVEKTIQYGPLDIEMPERPLRIPFRSSEVEERKYEAEGEVFYEKARIFNAVWDARHTYRATLAKEVKAENEEKAAWGEHYKSVVERGCLNVGDSYEIDSDEEWPVYQEAIKYVTTLTQNLENNVKGFEGEERKNRILSTLARANLSKAIKNGGESETSEE